MSLLDTASLIVTPNAYKEGKLYSVIPSDGSGDMSVTRATTATRVNSAGLVELVPYNLQTYSQDFSNAAWTITNGTATHSQTDPNGGSTATKIVFSSIGALETTLSGLSTSSNYTLSIYVKSESGSVSFEMGNIAGGSYVTRTATTNWQRFEFTQTPTGSTRYPSWIKSTGATTLYVAFAQAVEGSTAKDYQKTETRLNIPRLDYSNGTCPSLLVEPQRTNLAYPSQDITVLFPNNMTNTANQTISPDGTQNADKSTISATNAYHDAVTAPVVTTVIGTTYTTSFFAKKGTGIEAVYFYQSDGTRIAKFNLNDGSYIGHAPSNGYNAFTSYSSQSLENGWYRFTATYTASNTSTQFVIGVSTNTNDSVTQFAGNGTDFVYIWGLQFEAGSYATSYIPTTSASVTRNADVISKTGISSLIGQTEGTLFAEVKLVNLNSFSSYVAITSGAFTNAVMIGKEAGVTPNKLFLFIRANGSNVLYNTSISLSSDYVKCAIAYKSGNWAAYVNGTLIASGTSTFSFSSSLDRFGIGTNNGDLTGVTDKSELKATALWKTRLTNDELERLTGTGFNTYTEMANYYNYITQ